MGYSETYCQICGVSFAIARIRRKDEPPEAAWTYYGSDFFDEADEEPLPCYESTTSTGCESLRHGNTDEGSDSDTESPPASEDIATEHIAGPGCISTRGYSGWRISMPEMEGCTRVQCLVTKKEAEEWQPEEGDEEFELNGKYFLTGYGYGSPDEGPLEIEENVRHGVSDLLITNRDFSDLNDVYWGLPFHPTCFELFRHACEQRLGYLDAEGLVESREVGGKYTEFFEEIPYHPAVKQCSEQWWDHALGTEWLVANPVRIPGLQQTLEANYIKPYLAGDDNFDNKYCRGPFKSSWWPDSDKKTNKRPLDCFEKLPQELLDEVMMHLSSRDLTSLRTVTRAAGLLPRRIFKKLIAEDFPWFWEVANVPTSSDFATMYAELASTWWELRGMRNRRRIWKSANYIIDRIQELRAEGKIPIASES